MRAHAARVLCLSTGLMLLACCCDLLRGEKTPPPLDGDFVVESLTQPSDKLIAGVDIGDRWKKAAKRKRNEKLKVLKKGKQVHWWANDEDRLTGFYVSFDLEDGRVVLMNGIVSGGGRTNKKAMATVFSGLKGHFGGHGENQSCKKVKEKAGVGAGKKCSWTLRSDGGEKRLVLDISTNPYREEPTWSVTFGVYDQ